MPMDIQQYIKERWKLVSTIPQCQRGRLLALKMLKKEYEDQFAHIRGYVEEIHSQNPGSVAFIDTLVTAPPEPVLPGRKKEKSKKGKFSRIKGKNESPKKKKRKKNEVEKLARTGRTIHCKSCGEAGHNALGCKTFPKEKVPRQSRSGIEADEARAAALVMFKTIFGPQNNKNYFSLVVFLGIF
ncbi:hypothetical protein ISN44_As11g036170 [Arabidopsis suecica]|uniref:CCHC-type domain-containing protein n=1 Tax=Arabidopsis suecica TaxID=45249 RepID=A0A8T1ZHJ7_ARASU|nr:hypothetical protein ISN44_As11g036170 [Arabidopsis suecica]